MKPRVLITDHAILRYLERILELDIDAIRNKLESEIAAAAGTGAKTFTSSGATFIFERTPNGSIHCATILTEKMRMGTHRRREHRMQRDKEAAR